MLIRKQKKERDHRKFVGGNAQQLGRKKTLVATTGLPQGEDQV